MRYREIITEALSEGDVFRHVIDGIRKVVPEAIEIWFHGSRARGDHRPDSDWDFIVVVPQETSIDRYVDLVTRDSPLQQIHGLADIQVARPSDAESSVEPLFWAKTKHEGRILWSKLTEAPIADFQYIDKSLEPWIERGQESGPTGDSFRNEDRRALQSPKWREKLIKQFSNTIEPINLYAVNAKFLRTYVNGNEMTAITTFISDQDVFSGNYSAADFKKTFGFLPPEYKDALNFVFVMNEGDERMPFTPWIVGHRMIHALLSDEQNKARKRAEHTSEGHWAFESAASMMSAIRHAWEKAAGKDFYAGTREDRAKREKDMWATVTNLTSARNHKIERSGEVIIELMTQYLFTGDFKIDLTCFYGKNFSVEQEKAIRRHEQQCKERMNEVFAQALGHLIVF